MPANEHDNRYKKLFSNPILFRELVESFVDREFVKDLDFSTLRDARKSFVSERFQSKESDIIYQINYRGKEAYIFLLIEFQSTVDKYMALRILRYILEFYDDIITNDKNDSDKLPPVFPILLYNGDFKWTAPTQIRGLIECGGIDHAYLPDFEYFKICENEFRHEDLLKIKNAVSAIFYLENSDPIELAENFGKIVDLISTEKIGRAHV